MKYKKWLLKSCMIILLTSALVIEFKKLNIDYTNTFISPNKTNIIKIEAKGPTGFLLFGPSDIKIYCRKNKFISLMNRVTISASLFNDGGRIDDTNFNVEWINEDIATITLLGEEQQPRLIKVNFDENISYKYSY